MFVWAREDECESIYVVRAIVHSLRIGIFPPLQFLDSQNSILDSWNYCSDHQVRCTDLRANLFWWQMYWDSFVLWQIHQRESSCKEVKIQSAKLQTSFSTVRLQMPTPWNSFITCMRTMLWSVTASAAQEHGIEQWQLKECLATNAMLPTVLERQWAQISLSRSMVSLYLFNQQKGIGKQVLFLGKHSLLYSVPIQENLTW